MLVEDTNFDDHKKNALNKLNKALDQDKVDKLVIHILQHINEKDEYFTTSSCAGRIVVLQLPRIGDKKHAVFLGRWHRQVHLEEVQEALSRYTMGQAWLLTQPPIFHIGCKDLEAANELLTLGVTNGFKHSGIRSLSGQIIVELNSTERMDMPIGKDKTLFIDDNSISFLVDVANTSLFRAQKKLSNLKEAINQINEEK